MKPDDTIGGYRLGQELGRGGMGVVFEAAGPISDRLALKLLGGSGVLDGEALERFLREGRLLARVDHPNVLRIRDLGRSSEGPYLVTDRIEGDPLDRLLRTGPVVARRAVELVAQLADGVAAIHAEGILHRDLKPENVVLRPDGTPVLLDFGLARELDGSSLTQSGTLLGTPAYMAPEQARGEKPDGLDVRVDVYGLGAVLFALLTGRPPHDAGSLVEILRRVVYDPLQWPSEVSVPGSLRARVEQALAKAPVERFGTAAAFAAALRAWLDEDAQPAEPRSRAPALLIGTAGLLLVVLVGLLVWKSRAGPTTAAGPSPTPTPGRLSPLLPRPESTEPWTPKPLPSAQTAVPPWFARPRVGEPPPLPLPKGLRFGAAPWEFVNEVDGSVLVWVPPGEAILGPPGKQRTKRFTRGFYIGKLEVTRAQFAQFLKETSTPAPAFWGVEGREASLPALGVAYRSGAQPYTRWAGGRLPTADEWEYAARGPKGQLFPWGATPQTWAEMRSRAALSGWPRPVGSFPNGASPFGCLDMIGNAIEYVDDVAMNLDGGEGRGARGGSFDLGKNWALVWQQATAYTDKGLPHSGFRFVRDPD